MGNIAFTSCINNERLVAVDDIFSNEAAARSFCDSFSSSSTLGPILGEQEFIEITDALKDEGNFVNFNNEINLKISIGLESISTRPEGSEDTTVFGFSQSTDFEGIDFFHGQPGMFPWSFGQPNNFDGVQNCANLVYRNDNGFVTNGRINDLSCDQLLNGAICRTECFLSEFDYPIANSSDVMKFVLENEVEGSVTINQASNRCSLLSDEATGKNLVFDENFTIDSFNFFGDENFASFLLNSGFSTNERSTSFALGKTSENCFRLDTFPDGFSIQRNPCNSLLDGFVCIETDVDLTNDDFLAKGENEKKKIVFLVFALFFGLAFILTILALIKTQHAVLITTEMQSKLRLSFEYS